MKKLSVFAFAAMASFFAYGEDLRAPRSVEEIIARWERCRPTFTDWRVMEKASDFNDPFVLGAPKAEYAKDGLGMLNFVRYLAGLPDDIGLDADLGYKAQALTAVNAMNGVQSHTPARPAGVPKDVYEAAYPAGPRCNLQMSISEGSFSEKGARDNLERRGPYHKLAEFRRYYLSRSVLDFVSDADFRNVRKAEHRRNIFRPQLGKTGFGFVDFYEERPFTQEEIRNNTFDPGFFADGIRWYKFDLRQFMSMFAGDSSRTSQPSYDYVAWPARGYFPLEFWRYKGEAQPWSVHLNPAKYRVDDPAALAVEIAGVSNGYRVGIGSGDRPEDWNAIGDDDLEAGDKLKKFLRYMPATANWDPVVIFFPGEAKWPEPKAGERYRVTLTGVKDLSGKSVRIEYWTEFFSLPRTAWLESSTAED